MRIANAWIGLGLGDASDEVRKIKAHLRRKFSYARHLADSPLYDSAMVEVVAEMQTRYIAAGLLRADEVTLGVINVATKIACGYLPRPPRADTRPLLLTVAGTGVPWWVGPDADTARALEDRYLWQPIGYPAQAVPMGPSIRRGRDELAAQMYRHRDRITRHGAALAGYSQGALVISESWTHEISSPSGRLHWAAGAIAKTVTWGNPMREAGSVWPDAGGAPSPPRNRGVTPELMTGTPTWWRDYAHRGDLYTDSPPDESGENRTAIWQVIRDGSLWRGPDSLLRQVLELTGLVHDAGQVAEATGIAKAMIDAVVFFGKGTAPHTNYSIREAVDYLRSG